MPSNAIAQSLDKDAILKQAAPMLEQGIPTDEIVAQLGVPITGRTLRNWIVSEPSVASARTRFFSNKLTECAEAIEDSADVFPLARAREAFKSWSHIAGVRDPANFGQRQQIDVNQTITLNVAEVEAGDLLRKARKATQQGEIIDSSTNENDVTD